MIKIKYLIENGIVTAFYEDKTALSIPYESEESLKDLYILSKNRSNRVAVAEVPENLETWHKPQAVATKMIVDWYNLSGKVYDQFGEKMNVDVTFEIEGTGARIEDGTIIEDVVENDTSYFIVAKYGNLEERQERFLYAPRESEPSEIDILNNEIEKLKQTIDIILGVEDIE